MYVLTYIVNYQLNIFIICIFIIKDFYFKFFNDNYHGFCLNDQVSIVILSFCNLVYFKNSFV